MPARDLISLTPDQLTQEIERVADLAMYFRKHLEATLDRLQTLQAERRRRLVRPSSAETPMKETDHA